jgi:hypothetical protein
LGAFKDVERYAAKLLRPHAPLFDAGELNRGVA